MATTGAPKATELRKAFGGPQGIAMTRIAQRSWGDFEPKGDRSDRFVYLQSADHLTLICGAYEEKHVHEALPYGLQYAAQDGLGLRLVLPQALVGRTLARSAWLKDDAVEVWSHDGRTATRCDHPTREQISAEAAAAPIRLSPAPALRAPDSDAFDELLEWLADESGPYRLDPAHTSSYRAWQFAGRVVLRFSRARGGKDISIRAGISGKGFPPRVRAESHLASRLTASDVEAIRQRVEAACRYHKRGRSKPDRDPEGWLQSLLRARPALLGLEQPVLREVPVWRSGILTDDGLPADAGRIDLLGLDSLGGMILVETKLGADVELAFQGLDYWIWLSHHPNRERVAQVLDASPDAPATLAFVVGAKNPKTSRSSKGESPFLHPAFRPSVESFADDVDWRVGFVSDWYRNNGQHADVTWEPRGTLR